MGRKVLLGAPNGVSEKSNDETASVRRRDKLGYTLLSGAWLPLFLSSTFGTVQEGAILTCFCLLLSALLRRSVMKVFFFILDTSVSLRAVFVLTSF